MSVDVKDVEQVAQELQAKFDAFKEKNDKRPEAVEQEKGKLAGEVETLNGKLSELDELKSALEEELKQVKRPAGGPQSKAASEYKTAFIGFMRKGKDDGLRELERKALQVGVDEDGGYAVPEELDRTILNLLKDEVVMRREATTITVGGANYKNWLTSAVRLPAGLVKLMPARKPMRLNSVRLSRSWEKFTVTRRRLKPCWMMPFSMSKTGSTANWQLSLQSRKKSPLPAVTGRRSRKVFWHTLPRLIRTRLVHLVLSSTFSLALRQA